MSNIGNRSILSKNLKKYIERSGKDRRELASIWGYPYSTVSEWVNGKKYPRIDRIEVMADYFGINMSDLIEEKMTEEKEMDNEAFADLVVRMRMDEDFRKLVMSLYALDSEKIKGVSQMLDAFAQYSMNQIK